MTDRLDNQHLLIDADDTLWENHAYFLDVHITFLDLMEERGFPRDRVTRTLHEIESVRTRTQGYGSRNFALSLIETVRRLNGSIDRELEERLLATGRWVHDHPIELFPGVRETLAELEPRHELILVTKGDPEEQHSKLERSGLRPFFDAVEILPEKSTSHYHEIAERHGLREGTAWMIGNSPKSDINPARRAGLRTVHIPHRSLWEFEAEDMDGEPDLTLSRFRELTKHF